MAEIDRGDVPAPDDVARHPILRAIRRMEGEIATKDSGIDFRGDPRWLALPAERRRRSLARLDAVTGYISTGKRSVDAARAAAERGGVSLRLFYQLVAAWQAAETPDVWLLVPYATREAGEGPPRLDPGIADRLRELVEQALDDGGRSRGEVFAAVSAAWPLAMPRPAPNTIRQHIEALAGDRLVEKGVVRAAVDMKPGVRADRHGEVLVVDHVGLSLRGDHETDPAPLTLTVAIDLFTATIAGFQTSALPPSPDAVRAVLLDAGRSSRSNPGVEVTPRVVLNATNGKAWRGMAGRFGRDGVDADIRWGSRLHTGVHARRLIGPRIGPLAISPRIARAGRGGGFDPERHALVTPHEAELVVGHAVAEMNAARLGADAVLNRIRIAGGDRPD